MSSSSNRSRVKTSLIDTRAVVKRHQSVVEEFLLQRLGRRRGRADRLVLVHAFVGPAATRSRRESAASVQSACVS